MNAEPIVVEQTYRTPADVVWNAISNADQMRQWFFPTMGEFRPEVGFETCFDVECEGNVYPHAWKVIAVEPGRRIVYEWRYRGYPGDSTVTWELNALPSGTRLTLCHVGHETFPQENPVFRRESCEAGWRYFLQDSLRSYLESRQSS